MVTYKQWCERYERDPATQQARDEYAEYCRQLDIFEGVVKGETRGRKPKYGRPMTAAQRMAVSRARRKEQGMQQVWLSRELVGIVKLLQKQEGEGEPVSDDLVSRLLDEVRQLDVK